MPKFSVDVKAFINIDVEAKNERQARALADGLVEGLEVQSTDWRIDPGSFVVDGESDVDDLGGEICGQCLDPRCDGCVPFDTPSLDTSVHVREMDV